MSKKTKYTGWENVPFNQLVRAKNLDGVFEFYIRQNGGFLFGDGVGYFCVGGDWNPDKYTTGKYKQVTFS
ncbi:hypothetical protein HUN08_12485 [Gordonia sp. X0973]|uniref:hypothetical protein n=1 Tax=Gordonia sp. X0973 TaxID=2742602 RepID=UPI0013ED3421|nr:hypothetical protein [Gordonia sp. X0973]QKT07913.1 hypothetical protein HUN08_12485 [Gordonia sp. X0973]